MNTDDFIGGHDILALERFLERISLSEYRDKFILKKRVSVAARLDCYKKRFGALQSYAQTEDDE